MTSEDQNNSSSSSQASLDQAKFELEKWQIEEEIKLKKSQAEEDVKLKNSELDIKRDDIKLRQNELDIKQRELSRSKWSSPLLLAIVGVVTTLLVSMAQNYFQSQANTRLERQRFESALIQKALELSTQEASAKRFDFLLKIGLITDEEGKIAEYVKHPDEIPLQPPGDVYKGVERKAAKLSVGDGVVEKFDDLKDLIASLPPQSAMLSRNTPITTDENSARVSEEQRNVLFRGFLYAASKEDDNDFHLIIGHAPGAKPEMYMTVVVSGLPPSNSPEFPKLKAARDACKGFFGDHLPGFYYDFYSPPIQVEIEGSLFFNVSNAGGRRFGPTSLTKDMPTIWEVHPVTKIVFEP